MRSSPWRTGPRSRRYVFHSVAERLREVQFESSQEKSLVLQSSFAARPKPGFRRRSLSPGIRRQRFIRSTLILEMHRVVGCRHSAFEGGESPAVALDASRDNVERFIVGDSSYAVGMCVNVLGMAYDTLSQFCIINEFLAFGRRRRNEDSTLLGMRIAAEYKRGVVANENGRFQTGLPTSIGLTDRRTFPQLELQGIFPWNQRLP